MSKVEIPPSALPALWALGEIRKEFVPKALKAFHQLDFEKMNKICSDLLLRAQAAEVLSKRAAFEFPYLKEGKEPPGGKHQPQIGPGKIADFTRTKK